MIKRIHKNKSYTIAQAAEILSVRMDSQQSVDYWKKFIHNQTRGINGMINNNRAGLVVRKYAIEDGLLAVTGESLKSFVTQYKNDHFPWKGGSGRTKGSVNSTTKVTLTKNTTDGSTTFATKTNTLTITNDRGKSVRIDLDSMKVV